MRLAVVDASVVVELLTDSGPEGEWAAARLADAILAAPQLMPYEAGNILRRQVLHGNLDVYLATLAQADLVSLPVDLLPYSVVADRVWRLRENLTAYDAAYVAVAEMLGAPLLTLDVKLARAPGLTCSIDAFESPC